MVWFEDMRDDLHSLQTQGCLLRWQVCGLLSLFDLFYFRTGCGASKRLAELITMSLSLDGCLDLIKTNIQAPRSFYLDVKSN